MPPENTDPGATSGSAQGATPPGATPGAAGGQVQSQGPNDPLNAAITQTGQGPAGDPQTDPQLGEAGREAIRREREARAEAEKQRDAARRELEEQKRAGLSDEERKRLKEADEREAQRAQREKSLILRYEIATRAPKLGIVDPEIAVMLLERNADVHVSDDGTVTGIDEALKQLIKDKPHLVRATTTPIDGGAGSGGSRTGTKPSMNDFIRAKARGGG